MSRIVVDPTTMIGTEQPLLSGNWCQQYPSHSVGDLVFGRDGYLYMTAGDGANFNFADFGQDGNPVNPCGDPPGGPMTGANAEGGALRSQDLLTSADPLTFDGSMLRLDVSGASVTAPPDNPLTGNATAEDDLVVASGLRNPFRMTARPNTDEIWIADVGWNAWEEINRVEAATGNVKNFGWPCLEGTGQQSGYASRNLCQMLYAGTLPPKMELRAPYYSYAHGDTVVPGDGCGSGGSSITGLAFNGGSHYPTPYAGALFFADATRQCIWTMFAGGDGQPNPASRQVFVTKSSGRVVDLQMGLDGKLYYVDFDGGRVYRIAYFPANTPPVAAVSASPTSGPLPLAVSFDASASNDAEDGAALAFAWDLDGDGAFDDATGPLASVTYTTPGQHVATVQVTDSGGLSRTASVAIVADNSPPVPVIDTPLSSYRWSANEILSFSGHATDPEDGPLPPERLSFRVLLHHCATPEDCHIHPLTSFSGVASGTFQAPDHEYPAYLELELTASDASSGSWWDPAFRHRIALTLTGTLPATELLDVPVLVRLDPSRIPYAELLPNGADLRLVDEAGAALAYEIENWDPAGTSAVWVKLPRLSAASAGKQVFLYYGNANATDAQSPAAVWSNGYAAVWHLGQTLVDSTANANQGTAVGAVPTPGRIGGAYQFDGISAYLNMGGKASLAVTTNLSLEAFIRVDDPGQDNYGRVVDKKTLWDATAGYDLEYNPGLNYLSSLGSGADYVRGEGVNLDAAWHYVASTISGSTGRVYADGVDRTTDPSISPVVASTQALHIGRRSGGGDYFRGAIDEVRVSSVTRSAAWIALQNTSMHDALFSFGAPEEPATLTATTSVILQPKTVALEVRTAPPGLGVTVGSASVTTPFVDTVIDQSTLSVSAPLQQDLAGVTYSFSGWSDGGAATHLLVATGDVSPLTAVYTANATCNDGVQNGGETRVDCGGPCPPCPACEPESCDDANPCTADSCDPESGCQHTNVTGSCSDDGNACTDDVCSAGVCTHPNNTASCSDDGDVCTSDVCSAGVCTHPDNGSCTNGPFLESGGTAVMEAEHFHSSVARANHGWELLANASASGGQTLQANPNNGANVNTGYTTGSPELRFQVNFSTTGTYNVWLRGIGPNGDADSCHAGIDGTGPASSDRISSFNTSLGWSRSTMDGSVATLNVTTPGLHTVNIWMREDGFVLDKIVLTTNGSFTPTGAGPAESARQSSGCTSAAQCNDQNPCTTDSCVSGGCQNSPVANGASCTDDGDTCTNDVCNAGTCTHPSNGTCTSSPCSAYCSNPTTFTSNNFQSGNLGTEARCYQTTATLNGGVCGNFATGRTLSVNGTPMSCSGSNWPALPAKVNGGYCIYTNAGNHPWAYFTTW